MTKYRGEVYVEIDLDLDDEDAFQEAHAQIDTIMQRAWDTDQGRHHVKKWHFEMLEDAITAIDKDVEEIENVTDETLETPAPPAR